MIKTYKILSLLLSYPGDELQQFLDDVDSELKSEMLLPNEVVDGIARFVHHFKATSITDWQAHYVQLFDNSRRTSLYLFEHLKGDSKDRGQAMVDLIEMYRHHGLELCMNELPDYLPVFLEFLSDMKSDQASDILAETIAIIDRIYRSLDETDNIYRYILQAVISLSSNKPNIEWTGKTAGIDHEEREEPVYFRSEHACFNCKP